MAPANVAQVRQFARAVFADRLIGDELTRLAVAKAELDPKADADDPRELMRAFLFAWRAANKKDKAAVTLFSDRSLLDAIPPPPGEERLMLLLVDVMGFSIDEARRILHPMTMDAETALKEGRKIIDRPRSASAVVIEDEPLIAAELRCILEHMGVKVSGLAATASRAVDLAGAAPPDLILADYNLQDDETGADAVARIHEARACPVIFITGYPERVLQGEGVEPDFVIAKPYRLNAVRAAIAHCLDSAPLLVAD